MNALKLIIQIGCLAFLAVIALILARDRHGAGTNSAAAPTSQRWNFAQFEFSGPRITENGQKLNAHLVFYNLKGGESLDSEPVQTNRLIAIDQLLREIGNDGWQFVWTNGTNFITRRPEGEGRHAYFEVEYLPAAP